jgi:large subunit ribosomal protein L22
MVEDKKQTKETEKQVVEETVTNTSKVKEEKKKVETKKVEAKDVAIVNGFSQRVSTKYSFEVCKFVKNKELDKAIADLELVVKKKKAVPMHALEVAHKKGPMAGGKYPVNVAKVFIDLIKQLKANAVVNQVENPVITLAMANQASRPYRRAGERAKRTHIRLEAQDKTKLNLKSKK